MNWFKRKIQNWLNDSHEINIAESGFKVSASQDYEFNSSTVRFQLTPAVGGRILRVVRESQSNGGLTLRRGDEDNQVYVIPSGEDVGARVAKIINLEIMK